MRNRPLPPVETLRAAEPRFWPKVNKDGSVPAHRPELGACWVWTATTSQRYGQIVVGRRHTAQAHRFVYSLLVGPIPDGAVVDHLCRNTRCVNPTHLEAVTQRENVLRSVRPVRTHCRNGHPAAEPYRYQNANGRRQQVCRQCKLASDRRYKAGRRERDALVHLGGAA